MTNLLIEHSEEQAAPTEVAGGYAYKGYPYYYDLHARGN